MTEANELTDLPGGIVVVKGERLVGIRLGPEPKPDGGAKGARLEGCLMAVVAEGARALASDIVLEGQQTQLILEVAGKRSAGWSWADVIRIVADAIATDPKGNYVQLLEISTADHTFRFLAPAYEIGRWVWALPLAAMTCWETTSSPQGQVKDDPADTALSDLDQGGAGAAVGWSPKPATGRPTRQGVARTDGIAGARGNAASDRTEDVRDQRSWPTDGAVAQERSLGGKQDMQGPIGPSAKREAPAATSRHQKRRLFGRSAKTDRHSASSLDRGDLTAESSGLTPEPAVQGPGRNTEPRPRVTGFQVVRILLTPRSSLGAAHAGRRALLFVGSGVGRHAMAKSAMAKTAMAKTAMAKSSLLNGPRRRLVTGVLATLIAGVVAAGSAAAFQPAGSGPSANAARHLKVSGPVAPDWPQTNGVLSAVGPPSKAAFHLAAAKSKPLPAPPSLASQPSLLPHEVFAFAPYWTLPSANQFDLSRMTTLSYFGVDVNANGSIQESGDGWTGYQSQDLASLISAAHAAGDRVVLTAECFDQTTLNQLTSSPAAAETLAKALVSLVEAKNFDGINIDFEGQGSGDQLGLDNLMAKVSSTVRAANPHWQITMDTYASSAGDAAGFYDIDGLAPSVDAFFVMAYQMGGPSGATSSQNGGSGFSALDALQEYTEVVPAEKVILGLPYYGYDWPTTGPGADAVATGPATPMEDSQVFASKTPVNWNSRTSTAWTAYKSGGKWHQIWFEDQVSLAIRAQLAQSYGVRGVGIWSLGMDGNDPALLAALVGSEGVLKNFTAPPSSNQSQPSTNTTPSTQPTTSTTKPSTTSTTAGRAPTTTTSQPGSTTTSTTSTTSSTSTTSTTDPSSTTTTDPSSTTTTSAFSPPTT